MTGASLYMRFAGTLAVLRETSVQSSNSAFSPTITNLTAFRIADVQIPVERFAFITNTSLNTLLALAKFAHGHRSTTSKLIDNAGGITVATLTAGEIIETFLAHIALFAIEVVQTQANAVSITGDPLRAMQIAVAS